MNIKRRVVNNAFWLAGDKIVRMAVGLVASVTIARYLGAEDFGQLSYVMAIVGLATPIVLLGLNEIGVARLVAEPENEEEILCTIFLIQAASAITVIAVFLTLIFMVDNGNWESKYVILILAVSIIFQPYGVARLHYEGAINSKSMVLSENIVFLSFAILKILMVVNNGGLVGLVTIMLLEQVCWAFVMHCKYRNLKNAYIKFSCKLALLLLRQSWPLMLAGLAVVVYMRLDQIMIRWYLGDAAVGIFSAAVRVTEAWYFIPISIVASVFPILVNLKENGQNEEYLKKLQNLLSTLTFISIAVAVVVTIFSRKIESVLFGEEYANAGNVIAIHVWGMVFVFLGVASSKWLILEKKEKEGFYRTVLGAIVNLGLNALLIPFLGIEGAALSTVISFAFASLFYDLIVPGNLQIFKMKIASFNVVQGAKLLLCEMRELKYEKNN